MAHTPPDHLTTGHEHGRCESSVSAAVVAKRFQREEPRGRRAAQPSRGVTVRYISLRFVTPLDRPGSQEVDGSIPFSSTILAWHSAHQCPFHGMAWENFLDRLDALSVEVMS